MSKARLLLCLLLTGCGAGEYRADTTLLVPWTEEAQARFPAPPYVARYEHDGKRLSYLASRHEHRPGNPVFQMVAEEFDALEPQVVVIEGLRRTAGMSPDGYRDWVSHMPEGGLWPGGEAAYAASLAIARGIPFAGGEPDPEEILAGMAGGPFSRKDLIYFFVLRQIPQWRRTGEDVENGFERLYAGFLEELAHEYPLDIAGFEAVEGFSSWYAEVNGQDFDVSQITTWESAPISDDGALYSQRVSAWIGRIRDARICRVIAEMLNRSDRVLVVYGAGHHVQQAPVLASMLGPPVRTAPRAGADSPPSPPR